MESAIGEAAERIYAYLTAHSGMFVRALQQGTHVSARELHMGLGWLAG